MSNMALYCPYCKSEQKHMIAFAIHQDRAHSDKLGHIQKSIIRGIRNKQWQSSTTLRQFLRLTYQSYRQEQRMLGRHQKRAPKSKAVLNTSSQRQAQTSLKQHW